MQLCLLLLLLFAFNGLHCLSLLLNCFLLLLFRHSVVFRGGCRGFFFFGIHRFCYPACSPSSFSAFSSHGWLPLPWLVHHLRCLPAPANDDGVAARATVAFAECDHHVGDGFGLYVRAAATTTAGTAGCATGPSRRSGPPSLSPSSSPSRRNLVVNARRPFCLRSVAFDFLVITIEKREEEKKKKDKVLLCRHDVIQQSYRLKYLFLFFSLLDFPVTHCFFFFWLYSKLLSTAFPSFNVGPFLSVLFICNHNVACPLY